jgi:hypothetical protein
MEYKETFDDMFDTLEKDLENMSKIDIINYIKSSIDNMIDSEMYQIAKFYNEQEEELPF